MELKLLFNVLRSVYWRLYPITDFLVYKSCIGFLVEDELVFFIHDSYLQANYNTSVRGIYYNPKGLDIGELVRKEKKNRVKLSNSIFF